VAGAGATRRFTLQALPARATVTSDVLGSLSSPPRDFVRMVYLSSRLTEPSSIDGLTRDVERAADLGFTDVVLPWPRPTEPFQGDEGLLEELAGRLPELHRIAPID
jgi:hypothetical protein